MGYASITEADLRHYPGMALLANGGNVLRERLGHSDPPSYPYLLRYKDDNAARLAIPASIDGEITTPWRVVMMARDLNTLVNSNAIHNLAAPLLVYGGHPASLLTNPAADVIKSIPSVWDETRVLPSSEIGELAVFARRRGDDWFVGALNGPVARTVTIDSSFLGTGIYKTTIVRDNLENDAAVEMETRDARRGQRLQLPMRAGGGFVVRFTR